MPKLQPIATAVAMALMCNGVEGNPDVILIDMIPISPHFLRSEFAVNLEQGTASVQFRLNEYPGDKYARDTYISKAIPSLNYDAVSHEIRYKDVACAKVTEHTFLVTHWHFVDETGLSRSWRRRSRSPGREATVIPTRSRRSTWTFGVAETERVAH